MPIYSYSLSGTDRSASQIPVSQSIHNKQKNSVKSGKEIYMQASNLMKQMKVNPKIDWTGISKLGNLSKEFLNEFKDCLDWDEVLSCQDVDEDTAKTIVPMRYYDLLLEDKNFNTYSKEFQLFVVRTAIDAIWGQPDYWMQYLSDEMKAEADRLLNIIKEQYSNSIEAYCEGMNLVWIK
jgi:hypothetical protein